MKKLEINRLDWDSDFFNIEVGEITVASNAEIDVDAANGFDLIVIRQHEDNAILIPNFENNFQETKVVFSKKLSNATEKSDVIDYDEKSIPNTSLYPLAFESGKYSRFKLDNHFTENQFQSLYKKWIDNSLNKQFADKVFYIMESNSVCGFVTVKKHTGFASIGLIAVSENQQGKGYGFQLLEKAEQYCIFQSIFELRIPTQTANLPACNFYYKQGYTIFEETIIKHYRKK